MQLAKLNEEKLKLEKGLLQQKQTIDFTKLIQQIEQFVQNPVLDEEMLHKLIERIEIKEDGSPRIHYRFSDPYISSIFLRVTHSTPHVLSSIFDTFSLKIPISRKFIHIKDCCSMFFSSPKINIHLFKVSFLGYL
ncbi:DUF4368 domain-containing protein [Robertmurraya massiliosenegalensis]|uniref:DUF4368 domain-containing protein n=1 Tax=Robertmurraya massiliosenegalensis TaxID=1287657 RepID=UPI0009FFE47C|nr:DUF4368 domain-containing protein [Robertmurraya massiliosenegalensis]